MTEGKVDRFINVIWRLRGREGLGRTFKKFHVKNSHFRKWRD